MCDHNDEELKKLVNVIIASLDFEELAQGYRRRLQILDSQIEALRQEREALADERRKLRAEREQLAALYQINMRILNLINSPVKRKSSPTTENRDNEKAESNFTR